MNEPSGQRPTLESIDHLRSAADLDTAAGLACLAIALAALALATCVPLLQLVLS